MTAHNPRRGSAAHSPPRQRASVEPIVSRPLIGTRAARAPSRFDNLRSCLLVRCQLFRFAGQATSQAEGGGDVADVSGAVDQWEGRGLDVVGPGSEFLHGFGLFVMEEPAEK